MFVSFFNISNFMKALLYIIILSVCSFSVVAYAQKVKGSSNRNQWRRSFGFDRNLLIPPVTFSGGTKKLREAFPTSNKKDFKTLQEAKNQLNNGEELQRRKLLKAEQVQMFVQTLNSVFTVADIQKQLPQFSRNTIRFALKKLTSSGKLTLLQQAQKGYPSKRSIWIWAAVLKERDLTSEEALQSYYENSNLPVNSKVEEVQLFIQSLASAFTFIDIHKQFPGFSRMPVRMALKKLTSSGKLTLLQQAQQGYPSKHRIWIRTAVLKERDLTSEEALQSYYENSVLAKEGLTPEESLARYYKNLPASYKAKQIQSFVRSLKLVFSVSDIQKQFPGFSAMKSNSQSFKRVDSPKKNPPCFTG